MYIGSHFRNKLTIAEIASKYQVHPNQVQSWKKRLQEGATEIFMNASERKTENKKLYTEDNLMQKIGRMLVKLDFLRRHNH